MKLNKNEALVLCKVLHPHVDFTSPAALRTSNFQADLISLVSRLEDFLLLGDEEAEEDDECEDSNDPDCCNDEEEEEDEEDEDDAEAEEDAAGEEDEEDDEESGEDEDVEAEAGTLRADAYVDGGSLHDLKPAKASNGAALEFEQVDGSDEVWLLVDGYSEQVVTHIKRLGKELHVRDDAGAWVVYKFKRFPKPWIDLLGINLLLEVEPTDDSEFEEEDD